MVRMQVLVGKQLLCWIHSEIIDSLPVVLGFVEQMRSISHDLPNKPFKLREKGREVLRNYGWGSRVDD